MSDWRTRLAEGLGATWEQSGLVYAVANGLEDYPGEVGRDLDVLVAPQDLRTAVSLTIDYCDANECAAVVHRAGWLLWIVIVGPTREGIRSFQVDLFDHLQWEFSWLLDGRRLSRRTRRGPFHVDAWSHFAKRFLINFLSTGTRVLEAKPHYMCADDEELMTLTENFERLAGGPLPELTAAVRAVDLDRLAALVPAVRRAIRRQGFRSGGFGARLWSAWQKQWAVNIRPRRAAPVIALNGRPGHGFDELAREFAGCFRVSFVYCQTRVEKPARSGGAWGGLLHFWKREFFGDRRRSALQVAHLYENHAAGQQLFGRTANGQRLPGWFARRAPRPDLSLVVVENDADQAAAELLARDGLVDRVFRMSGDVVADAASLIDSVMEWHRAKAVQQRALWDRGVL